MMRGRLIARPLVYVGMRKPRCHHQSHQRELHGYGIAETMQDSTTSRDADEPVEIFVREARAYCRFVEMASDLTLEARLHAARERLLRLYTAALDLPDVEPDDRAEPPSVDAPAGMPRFGDMDIYWEVFDPYDFDAAEFAAGDLSDDVLDVYTDVKEGLVLWDASQTQNAIWTWRFGVNGHWGDHAVDAMRALHYACRARPYPPR